jgi:Zn-dependent protease
MSIDWISAAWIYLVFVVSTTLHEAAHAWAAMKFGDDTAHRGGQVSLNPMPHIRRSPIGMVVVPLLTLLTGGFLIGWASTPYNVQWAMTFPRRSALMALAGPATNLLLVLLAGAGIFIGTKLGRIEVIATPDFPVSMTHVAEAFNDGGFWAAAATLLSVIFSLNLLLAVLNLMPTPPFDGAALPLLLMSENSARRFIIWWQQAGQWIATLGVVAMYVSFWFIFTPVWQTAVRLIQFQGPRHSTLWHLMNHTLKFPIP